MRRILAGLACCLLLASSAACGSDASSKNATSTAPAASGTSRTGTPAAPGGAATGAAGATTPGATGDGSSPAAGGPGSSGATQSAGANGGDAATAIPGGVDSVTGGDASQPREAVSTLPPPPPGTTPVIDPTTIAAPDGPPPATDPGVDPNALQLAVDLDAAAPGIQSTRDVAVGDVFRVAVVVLNIPDDAGLAAFNFELDYDRGVVIAPTFAGGEATDRNPDLNQIGVGADWSCLPAPQGDLDDAGGIEGDGNPNTGQAFLSCFTTGAGNTGDIVLATIEFHAVAAGSLTLDLTNVNVGTNIDEIARCGDSDEHVVPCTGAQLKVD